MCDTQDLDDPDGIVDQECFNKHPLTRVYRKKDASQIDPNFPGRYYTDPPCRVNEVAQGDVPDFDWPGNPYTGEPAYKMKMRYALPDIECEHCVLQMHWRESSQRAPIQEFGVRLLLFCKRVIGCICLSGSHRLLLGQPIGVCAFSRLITVLLLCNFLPSDPIADVSHEYFTQSILIL